MLKTQPYCRFVLLFVCLLMAKTAIIAEINPTPFSYEDQWSKVALFTKMERPESALKEVEILLQQAKKEQNTVQLIKASVQQMVLHLQIDPDKAPAEIGAFESLMNQTTKPTDKALLQSMTAELYLLYYNSNRIAINQRTNLTGQASGDVREWTKNQFLDKIRNLLNLSVQNGIHFQKTDVEAYRILFKEEENALPPADLYEWLMRREIELLTSIRYQFTMNQPTADAQLLLQPFEGFMRLKLDSTQLMANDFAVLSTFQEWLRYAVKGANTDALIVADLYRLKTCLSILESSSYIRLFGEPAKRITPLEQKFLRTVHALGERFSQSERVIDVLETEASFYLKHFMPEDSVQKMYMRKAYDLAAKGISSFPNSTLLGSLRNIQEQVRQVMVSTVNQEVVKPNSNLKVEIGSRNVDSLLLQVYRVDATALDYQRHTRSNKEPYPKMQLLEKRMVAVTRDSNFCTTISTITIKTGSYGIYQYTLEKTDHSEKVFRGTYVVSDMAFMLQTGDPTQLQVVDRVSGKPLPNVGLELYTQEWQKNKVVLNPFLLNTKTDKTGRYELFPTKNSQTVHIFFKRGADQYLTSRNYLYSRGSNNEVNKQTQVRMFTDRAVYRPGQTVHFKGIVYYSNPEKEEVIPSKSFDVDLKDANNKTVFTKTMMTNEFGSFSDSFVLPESGLNGQYSIRSYGNNTYFRVEAYKRPTFEVTMQRPKTEVHFGETVTVDGHVEAYAGYPLNDVDVSYRVIQKSHARWDMNVPDVELLSGVTKTEADGSFSVAFQPERSTSSNSQQYFTYEVTATATDSKGETQVGKKSVSVGDKSLFLFTNVNYLANWEIDSVQAVEIIVETLNGETVDTTVHYELYRLKPSGKIRSHTDLYEEPVREQLVRSGNHSTKDGDLQLDLSTLPTGSYQLVVTTEDMWHQRVERSTELVLYSQHEKRPPVPVYVWFVSSKTECKLGEKAHFLYGTSARDVHVLYQIMQGNLVLERKWLRLSNEVKTFDIPFESRFGDGITVQFNFIKDEEVFITSIPIKRKVESRKLSPKWSVFRDKLQPGEKAEWRLTIPELQDKKERAELLVYMYDASLDAIQPHYLWFSPSYRPYVPYSPMWSSTVSEQLRQSGFFTLQTYPVLKQNAQKLDWMNLNFNKFSRSELMEVRVAGASSLQGRIAGLDLVNLEEHKVIVEEKPSTRGASYGGVTLPRSNKKSSEEVEPDLTPRRNFNETAFFYPRLHTDDQGNATVSFTVPESLTRWKVNVLAHTKDLFSGIVTNNVITQKDLMVQLNLPRFVRCSDKLLLRAGVVNLTDTSQTVQVKLDLIDPRNEKSIPLKDGLTKSIQLAPKETKSVEWTLTEFAAYELVACKVVAWNQSFSDGEQRYLPVLPDRVLITEALPMTVRAGKSKTFELEQLLSSGSKNVQTQSLAVEFAPNPAWYAVQALPTLSTPKNENAIDYFTAYYANTLASYIVRSNPKIASVFDQWKAVGGSRDALLSNLEKNKELKTMLLEETPWVVAAQNESEQMKRIALLFDLNQQKQQNEQYWNKLLKLQKPSGGFSWFEDMPANRFVTQYILLNKSRLNGMLKTEVEPDLAVILNALDYLDMEITNDYNSLKKYNIHYQTTMTIGDMQWFYLHVRSQYPKVTIPEFAREAVAYYKKQAMDYWQKGTLYGQAATALIAARNKNMKLASQILVSLKENALKTEDMGMYWARNSGGFGWNQRPVSVQTMVMEAFAEISKSSTDLDEMKIWLLRQKQTQCWDSPLSTVDAVYALLCSGSDWLSTNNQVDLNLGGKTVDTSNGEAGTGYVKQTFAANETKPSMGRVQVSLKGNTGFGWGALYWQFYQDLKQVSQSGKALSVNKKLYVEKVQPSGKVLVPIENVALRKGDKVITRLVVNVDRDMEYVALKDLRAACFEPVQQRSGCVWKQGVVYYQTSKDASTQFFFSSLPKGSYVFEYEAWVNNAGDFTSGITTLECLYAPEFSAHSGGERISVSER